MRSRETISSRPTRSVIASTVSCVGTSSSCATKRAARSIRRGSSSNEVAGLDGVRSRRLARSVSPPNGSMKRPSGSRTAMALTVKSLRARSSSTLRPKVTSGFRESSWYTSDRKVVISSRSVPLRTPTVPKRAPWSQTPSSQPPALTISRIRVGSASVVKSTSGDERSSRASRTVPPTR